MIKLILKTCGYDGGAEYCIERFIFPGGEAHYKIKPKDTSQTVYFGRYDLADIYTDFQNPTDFMILMMLSDHLSELKIKPSLIMEYVPFSRQDRITSEYEPFSFKTFAKMINSCKFRQVFICDPHSDVVRVLINNVSVLERYLLMKDLGFNFDLLVSPDSGAVKSNYEVCKRFKLDHVIATKHRDTETGKITETKIHTDIDMKGKKILVADDLCDGGRTFIELAKVIRKHEPSTLELYVTHGLFSSGMKELYKYYDKVHCRYNCITGVKT